MPGILSFGLVGLLLAAPEPIVLYDLTPALKYDQSDPAEVTAVWEHVHAVATLQGVVNRDQPRLYVRFLEAHGYSIDDYWLKRMSEPGQWLENRPIEEIADLASLLRRFHDDINGAVVYDPKVHATSNLASALAGAEDLIAVRFNPADGSVYHRLVETGPKLPVVRRLLKPDGASMFTGRGKVPGTDRPSSGSAKCDAYLWMKHHYLDTGKLNPVYGGYYTDSYWIENPTTRGPYGHMLPNHDYFVARKAFFIDLHVWDDEAPVDDPEQEPGTDLETFKEVLLSAYRHGGDKQMIHIGGFPHWSFKYTNHGQAGGGREPVPTEWEYVKLISAYNAYCDADAGHLGVMANCSFFQHFPLKEHYPQQWVTREELRERGYLTEKGKVAFNGRRFFIFYVGDFDSAGWLYQLTPPLWDGEHRGKLPLMWAISPVLEERVPMALDYVRRSASENDYFVAADNGAGYLTPGMLQEPRPISDLPSGLDAWAEHCKPYYHRWDLTVTGFVIDGFAPGLSARGLDCYARFSLNGIVPQKVPPTLLHGNMPVMRADRDLPHMPDEAAKVVLDRIATRRIPFTWFRAVIKTPGWFVDVHDKIVAKNPKIELLDAPTFFELYRIWLENHPHAANGTMPLD